MGCATVLPLLHSELSVTFQLTLYAVFCAVILSLQRSVCQEISLQKLARNFFHVVGYYFLYSGRESAVRQTRNNLFVYFCWADISLLEFGCILNKHKGVSTGEKWMVTPKSSFTHLMMAVVNVLLQGETQN